MLVPQSESVTVKKHEIDRFLRDILWDQDLTRLNIKILFISGIGNLEVSCLIDKRNIEISIHNEVIAEVGIFC